MTGNLEIREFQRADNAVYSAWFSDPEMEKTMGPAWSEEELDQIEKEQGSVVLSVLMAQELVGILSVAYPDNDHSSYGIMGIAVAPHWQRRGIGGEILKALQSYFDTSSGQRWVAFVDVHNLPSIKFMQKHGWERRQSDNDMLTFTYKQVCG